ncbi:MAG TPA: acetate--CoA ligase family protein [Novosphingobium sp.]|nr:acetate--CoA ligase family protein [Novosphingobium sp.]
MPGFVYGLRQPAIIGELILDKARDIDFSVIDQTLLAIIPEFDPGAAFSPNAANIAERLAQLAIAAQRHLGHPVSEKYWITSVDGSQGRIFRCLFPAHHLRSTKALLEWLVDVVGGAIENRDEAAVLDGYRKRFAVLSDSLHKIRPESLNTYNLIMSAWELDVPVTHIVDNIYSFGTGNRARVLDSSFTDKTAAISATLAKNKFATTQLLRQAGIPAPEQKVVSSADQAVNAAKRLGYPVVVKPIKEDGGRGVSANLRDEATVREAVREALTFGADFLVERHFPGRDYRITVLDGAVIKVEQRVAGGVIGDGLATIAALVDRLQETPRHKYFRRTYGRPLLLLDAEAKSILEEQGLTSESVPGEEQFVPLRRKNNISAGGSQVLVPLAQVHPDNLALARRCADVLGLDLAGVDLLIPDISASWYKVGACICEVNAKPQIGRNTTPTIYNDLLKRLVGEDARIPLHLVIAADGEVIDHAALQSLMRELGCNALSTASGLWIDGVRLASKPTSGFQAARILIAERSAASALSVVTLGEIGKAGLPFDRFETIRPSSLCPKFPALMQAIVPHTAQFVESFDGT